MKHMTGKELIIQLVENDELDADIWVAFDDDDRCFGKPYKQGYIDCINDIINDTDRHMPEEKLINKSEVKERLVDLYCIKETELEE